MLVEEGGHFAEHFFRFRRVVVEQILGVAVALEHLQRRFDAGAAQLAVGADGVTEEQVARAAGQDRGRQAGEVAIDGESCGSFMSRPAA